MPAPQRGPNAPLGLSARAVTCRYGDAVALRDVSIEVAPGSCVAVVGESGSGKTTLLRCFNRMVVPDSGTITIGNVDAATLPVAELRRGIGYVPQHGGLLPHWDVLRNAALVPTLLGDPCAEDFARSMLALVGLPPERFAARFPRELSGGQRQRVAIARALAAKPGVLLLDEPFGALDAITRSEVQEVFATMRSEVGVTALLVTHDLAEAARLAGEIIVMRAGGIEQRGSIRQLRHSPATDYVRFLIGRAFEVAASLSPS